MADRVLDDGTGIGDGPTGRAYMGSVAEKVGTLFNSIGLRPVTITNTGNDYTITIDPVLNSDVVSPMAFYVKPNVGNTGPVRIRVTTANPYYAVVKANGNAYSSGQFLSDTNYLLVFLNGQFVTLSYDNAIDTTKVPFFQRLTSSGTLDLTAIKAVKNPDSPVTIKAWAGGGGGQLSGGGGGGFSEKTFKLSELSAITAYTIGAGGAVGVAGGNTTFGALITAYGGGAGNANGSGGGGGGGSQAGALGLSATGGLGGRVGGGNGGDGAATPSAGRDSLTVNGGGGGGGTNGSVGPANLRSGGWAVNGGGGGGGFGGGLGGTSANGGAGGADGLTGIAPSGGGGYNAAGARGEIVIIIP